MSKLFSKEIVNKGRQIELDITRGLAVLFMILIHFQQYFLPNDYLDTEWALLVDFLGGVPSAPVFMLIMGVGFVYTKKSNHKIFVKRGVMLIFAGYLLNFIRGFIPSLIQWLYTGYHEYLINGISQLLYVDILQFAGLAMITFGIFKYFDLNNYAIAIMGIIFSIFNIFLVNIKTSNLFLSASTGLLWGSNELTFFPFLTWIFYPIVGYLFGSFLMHCNSKKKFYLIIFFVAGIVWFFSIFVLQDVYGIDIGLFSENGYYQHSILGNIAFTGFVLWWISLCFFVSEYIPRFAMKTIDRWSKNVTDIYFAQWIIIGWLVIPLGYMQLNPPNYFYVLVAVIIASDLFAHIYKTRN